MTSNTVELHLRAMQSHHNALYPELCKREFPEDYPETVEAHQASWPAASVEETLSTLTEAVMDYFKAAASVPVANITLLEPLALFRQVPGKGKVVLVYPLTVDPVAVDQYPGVRYLKFDEKTNVAGDAAQAIANGEILLIPVSDEAKRQLVTKAVPYSLLYPCLSLRSDYIVKAVDIDPRHWAVRFFQASWEPSLDRCRNDSYAEQHHILQRAECSFIELLLGALIK